MRFVEGVDIPEEVLEAHREGKLVLFVGAGASKASPSNLPLFDELAKKLGKLARKEFNDEDKARIDTYIGSLPDDFDTHRHAAKLLRPEGSTPNDLHRALVRLATCGKAVRIVTTNFDNHLSDAAKELGLDLGDQWIGPALPLGRDFQGIVHLHGSLTRHHKELILDDRDFGRAYFGDGWAPRFLQPMFAEYVVLFVGYSLSDTVMRYLTLGLPSKTSRYTLVPKAAEGDFSETDLTRLQVTQITYPNSDGKHTSLPQALENWAQWIVMKPEQHQKRTNDLINKKETGEPLSPVEEDYLHSRISTIEGASTFTKTARSPEWLNWLKRLPDFEAIFAHSGELSSPALALAEWFTKHFVAAPTASRAAMDSLCQHQQTLHPYLFRLITSSIHQLEQHNNLPMKKKWKVILATSIRNSTAPPPFDPLLLHKNEGMSWGIIRKALTPFLKLHRSLEKDGWPQVELHWPVETYYLENYLLPWLDAQSTSLRGVAALEAALLSAYELLDAYDSRFSNTIGFTRSAIEDHSQNIRQQPLDIIIDGLRNLGVHLQESIPLHERWWEYGFNLFRRLALHLVATSSDLSSDEKIEWILNRKILYDPATRHETFHVLHKSIPEATPKKRKQLLKAVIAGNIGQSDSERWERTQTYNIYNLLVWLTRADPDWSQAAEHLARLQEENPNFSERENPDFTIWFGPAKWTTDSVESTEKFYAQVQADPALAITSIMDIRAQRPWANDFDDEEELIRGLASEHPTDGIAFWDAADSSSLTEEHHSSLRSALVSGWAKANLDEKTALRILTLVKSIATQEDNLYAVTDFLLEQGRKRIKEPDTDFLKNARDLAQNIWNKYQQSFKLPENVEAPSSLALNTWPGNLAFFWFSQIERRWHTTENNWSGFTEEENATLEELLKGPQTTLHAIWPAFGMALYSLDSMDANFTEKHVLPLFSRNDSLRHVWEPFLYRPLVSLHLLQAGLLNAIAALFEQLSTLNLPEARFEELAADVVTPAYSTEEPVGWISIENSERQQILDAAVLSEGGRYAADFARAVIKVLRSNTLRTQKAWQTWLHQHIKKRLNGIPRDAKPDELESWADITPLLGDHLLEAVTLFRDSKIKIGLGKLYFAPEFTKETLARCSTELV